MCYAATVPFTDLVNVRDPQKVVHAYDFGPILSYANGEMVSYLSRH